MEVIIAVGLFVLRGKITFVELEDILNSNTTTPNVLKKPIIK